MAVLLQSTLWMEMKDYRIKHVRPSRKLLTERIAQRSVLLKNIYRRIATGNSLQETGSQAMQAMADQSETKKDCTFAVKVDAFGARVPHTTQEYCRQFFEGAVPESKRINDRIL
eukprot:gb/GECG01001775.1/.p1 GENE.gb/GECG01001775.1/~~gb/GECG01001775.1/.p1  ORF type:complete len:114 (+),score=13.87 gb/GECG01001775.1/:1-342(+)